MPRGEAGGPLQSGLVFFFSSRRRHTRSLRDWSSDVCSSDLSATWCLGMSEPDAGSDVAAIATSAVRDGGEYVIDGAKVWTSFAEVAEHCYLIARTDPDAPPHAGLSELIVPMGSPGITVSPIK